MTEPLTITLRTLTPLWTGGADGKVERIHETGILGSLRWWYEAIVRGLGGTACDPTAHACSFNAEEYEKAAGRPQRERLHAAGLCDACQLFGATGWRRRFRLVVDDTGLQETWSGEALNVRPPDRNRGWYLNAGKVGTFLLKFIADTATLAQLLALIQFVARLGSLGARPQLGYGLVEIVEVSGQPKPEFLWNDINKEEANLSLPNLNNFTCFVLTFEPERETWWRDVHGLGALARDSRYKYAVDSLIRHRIMPTTLALKNVLRYGQQWSSGALPHQFFGTLRGEDRSRSKIAVSWAYQLSNSKTWQMRGWAYPPQVQLYQQQEIQQRLQKVLGKPETWLRALNVSYRSAEVSIAPGTTFFQPINREQVRNFVQAAVADGVQA
jgi:CRISPR-associated protein Cmr1